MVKKKKTPGSRDLSWGPGIRYGNYCKEVRNQQGTVVGLLLEVKFTNWDWST